MNDQIILGLVHQLDGKFFEPDDIKAPYSYFVTDNLLFEGKMSFPNKKDLDKVRSKLEKAEGTLMLASNATPLERFRWELCQKFIQYKIEHEMSQEEMAEALGVDKAKISKILHHRIDEFSTDRLIKLFQELNPKLKLKVS